MTKTLKNPYNDSCKLEQCIYNQALKDFKEWLMQKRQTYPKGYSSGSTMILDELLEDLE